MGQCFCPDAISLQCSGCNCWFRPQVKLKEAVWEMTLVLRSNETLQAFYPSPADTHPLSGFQWLPVATSHWWLLVHGFSTQHGVNTYFSAFVKLLFIEPEQIVLCLETRTKPRRWTFSKLPCLLFTGGTSAGTGAELTGMTENYSRGLRVLFVFLCQTSNKSAGLRAGGGK